MYSGREDIKDGYGKLADLFSDKRYKSLALITTKFPPYPPKQRVLKGGVDSDLEAMIERLRSNGFRVTIISLDYVTPAPASGEHAIRRINSAFCLRC